MKINDYLASRFIASQIGLHKQQTAKSLAENQAIRFFMWSLLLFHTVTQIFVVLAHYVGVLTKLRPEPKRADDIYAEESVAQSRAQAAREKMAAEITANLKKESFPENPEQGLMN